MDGQEQRVFSTRQHPVDRDRFLRVDVDVGPQRVIGADRDQRQVERTVDQADVVEGLAEPGVAGKNTRWRGPITAQLAHIVTLRSGRGRRSGVRAPRRT